MIARELDQWKDRGFTRSPACTPWNATRPSATKHAARSLRHHCQPRACPCKRMAAGALFRDGAERVLLVDPTYMDNWEVPDGAVEQEESPTAAG
jgi:hypothetical protein